MSLAASHSSLITDASIQPHPSLVEKPCRTFTGTYVLVCSTTTQGIEAVSYHRASMRISGDECNGIFMDVQITPAGTQHPATFIGDRSTLIGGQYRVGVTKTVEKSVYSTRVVSFSDETPDIVFSLHDFPLDSIEARSGLTGRGGYLSVDGENVCYFVERHTSLV